MHKTRSPEVKHTFNNKEAAIYQRSSQRAASFNCNNLRAVNSSHLIVKNLKRHYLCQAIIRATYNSGPFSIPCYGKSKVLRVKIVCSPLKYYTHGTHTHIYFNLEQNRIEKKSNIYSYAYTVHVYTQEIRTKKKHNFLQPQPLLCEAVG